MSRSVFYPRCQVLLTVVFDGRGKVPNSAPQTMYVQPTDAQVIRNGYQEPDTWRIEFDSRRLPFDPDIIASASSRIYMWNAESLGPSLIKDSYEMVRGLADDVGYKAGDSQVLTMSGRDYTGVLDGEWDPRNQIPSGQPLDQTVQALANAAAPANTQARFRVSWQAFATSDDDPSTTYTTTLNGRTVTLVNPPIVGASQRSTKKKGLWVKPGKTYWDLIYEMVTSNGFVCYVSVDDVTFDSIIVITSPRVQDDASLQAAPRLIYGHNLKTLEVKRKLAKERVPQIIIVYYDAKTRQQATVTYPETAREITTALGPGLVKNETMRLGAPKGVHDAVIAKRYAVMRWNLMARAEATYNFTTKDIIIDGPNGTEVDLLRLDIGQAVGISFDPFNREHIRKLSQGERVQALLAQGYSGQVARFAASNIERLDQFQQPYYFHLGTYDFSLENGIDISIEGVNFAAEAREQAWADAAITSDDVDATSSADPSAVPE